MSRISELSDELLITILSFLPTKVSVSTSILSKQWKFLWMWLPNLEYSSSYHRESAALGEFIDKNLPLHRAPVIESLRLDFNFGNPHVGPENIKRWVEISVSRNVRELEVSYDSESENIFPGSFYTCASLVILKLEDVTLMDVPSTGCPHSLKTLKLQCLEYANLQRLLSICPVLEELSVHFECRRHNMGGFTIIVPSLQSLSLSVADYWKFDGYVIDTPSLKYLKLEDWNGMIHYIEIEDMPNLKESYVDVPCYDLKSLIGSIKSVKRLTICSEDDLSGDGFGFNQLEHLQLCVCKQESSHLLGHLLKISPNLRVLDISHMEYHGDDGRNKMVCWNQPSSVPECLLSSLQILNWSRYFGRPQDRDIAVYILRNACHLKKATFLADTQEYYVPDLKMLKELTLSSRASSTCELVFVEEYPISDEQFKNYVFNGRLVHRNV
ncbi:hypothetical protein EUTSA_v10027772mg [Eutrema salsugineum]|uniref:FBD domain-containing protein n=2 Tax=Eutrema salsugineum TaxID=72664 RepID=V4LTE5_EUTSA|nr:hypothetical protein EUTSA_v10027772mg [Eutrema salsugineum]